MLNVHRSNRADRLVDHLAGRLAADPLPDPMATERIAVQSRGMERWLSHQLAHRLGAAAGDDGISANIDFPFPGRVVREVLAACDTGPGEDDPWRPDRLVWPVLELLPALDASGAERIRGYLGGGDPVDRRRYVLSRGIADLLDRYAMFRPIMVRAWSDGDDIDSDGDPLPSEHRWQPALWRALERRLDTPHLAARFHRAEERLREADVDGLPPRLTLFGTSQLPPSYLDLLVALAERIEVSLYAIVPSPELWRRVAAASGSADVEPRHTVLVSSGRLARDFQVLLERAGGYDGDDLFDDPAEGDVTALARLQSDLLRDLDRGDPTTDDPDAAAVALDDGDTSIQFHVCHGPARQVEVLHDRLLHLFADRTDLEPRDVLVMAPSIEDYAPLIAAVFDRVDAPIPFRIADRSLRRTNEVAGALLAVLDLVDGRVTASGVLDLLGHRPLRRRAGIDEAELGRIENWVRDSGVRWGVDADHRADRGQPADGHHTWRFGLDRLLLGVAMPDEEDRSYGGVVPYDDMEGGDVVLLGRLVAFCERVFRAVAELRLARPIADWGRELTTIVEEMTTVDDDERWLRDQTVDVLERLVEASAGPDGAPSRAPLTVDAVRSLLDGTVTEQRPGAGYETGAVTFCEMIPMRSIPHRVICLLGMDDGAFPRAARPLGFDLIADRPATGDRDRRDEDRLLLLEALLAARDHLVVLYTGRDQRTNEERAPAVPVGELRDVIDRAHRRGEDGPSDRLTVEHPLQAFSPRNFTTLPSVRARTGAPAPLSFEDGQLAAARVLRDGSEGAWRFLRDPLPEPEEDADVVELAELRRFLRDPTAWLCSQRLGLWLREDTEHVEDTEPVETDGLDGWRIGDAMLAALLTDDTATWADRDRWEAAQRGRGGLPVGTLGRYAVEDVRPTVERIAARVRVAVPAGVAGEDLQVDVAVDHRRLHGLVRGVTGPVRVVASYSRLKPAHRLALWVDHLALSVAHAGVHGVVVGRGEGDGAAVRGLRPLPPEEARAHLATLLDLFARGRGTPLPLFPTSSEAYVAAIARGRDHAGAMTAARRAWGPDYHDRGDSTDAHVVQCYGDDCSFDAMVDGTDFVAVAEAVWGPLLAAEIEGDEALTFVADASSTEAER